MRRNHELEHGVICEHCGTHCNKYEYKSIAHLQPVVGSTTGCRKTINRFNLCSNCYNEYMQFMSDFCGGKRHAN